MPVLPRLILVACESAGAATLFDAAPDGRAWDAVVGAAPAARATVPPPIVTLPPNAPLPRVDGGGTLWVRDLDQVESALGLRDGWQAIVFEPSEIAMLDRIRQRRQTLVARTAIPAGARLTAADLVSVPGGTGIGAELADRLVGCRLCYALAEGEPVTFGVVEAPEQPAGAGTPRSMASLGTRATP